MTIKKEAAEAALDKDIKAAKKRYQLSVSVKLYQGPELVWTRQLARIVRTMIDAGITDRPTLDELEPLSFLDKLIDEVNRRLPDGCRWAAGSSAIYGPEGTPLPDIEQLLTEASAEIRAEAAAIASATVGKGSPDE